MPPAIFQRELPPGWVYPCSLEDIRRGLARLPSADIEGIDSIGLVPCRPSLSHAYGIYYHGPRTTIQFPAWREPFIIRFHRSQGRGHLQELCAAEMRYGMTFDYTGGRWISIWQAEGLRRWICEHVLAHEVGHHVQHVERRRAGITGCPGYRPGEQFAEAYALRQTAVRLRAVPNRCSCQRIPHGDRRPHRDQQGRRLYPSQRAGWR